MTSSAQSIGIVIASFNDNRIIHTITSIKAADPHRVSRIYVMDAGSRPAVVDAIKLVLRPHDVLVSERDAGIYDGINKGLDRVKEEFVGWLGSDDFFTQNVNFDEILSRFAHGHLDCLIFDIAFIDDYGVARRSLAHAPTPNNYLLGKLVLHYSSFWRRSTIGTLRFDLQFPVAADQDFFLQLVSQKKLAYEIDNRVGTVMRLGGASTGGAACVFTARYLPARATDRRRRRGRYTSARPSTPHEIRTSQPCRRNRLAQPKAPVSTGSTDDRDVSDGASA